LLISLIGRAVTHTDAVGLTLVNANGNVQSIAQDLFTKYVWAFEVVSALLITAALGAMVLAHSERKHISQRQLSVDRFRQNSLAETAGLPASGVYARHNAVDVPALLPDGSPAHTSISATLEARGDMIASAPFELGETEEEEN
jgi:NADH-quinone oxidoreductase subunit J